MKAQSLISFFRKNGGVVRFSAILKAGFHPDSLAILEKQKQVVKVSRGLYKLTSVTFSIHPDLMAVSLQVPRGVICLLSALAFHEATNEIPKQVSVSIPRGTRANKIMYPPARIYRFTQSAWEAGIENHLVAGQKIRVYSLAKTVADCFKFRNKIGSDVAREALKNALSEKHIKPGEIMHYAKVCRVAGIIKPILEALL